MKSRNQEIDSFCVENPIEMGRSIDLLTIKN